MRRRDFRAGDALRPYQATLFAEGSAPRDWTIERALVVRQPWAEMIAQGAKLWEIRGAPSHIRGPIAIAAGGTGTIVGVCRLVAVRGPLSLEEYADTWDLRGGDELPRPAALPYPRTFAWVVADARPVRPAVPYRHPSGALIWVRLPEETRERLRQALRIG